MNDLEIPISGRDTATPLNLTKRLNVIQHHLVSGQSKVLDGGCGEGDYVVALRERFNVEAWGIEYLTEKTDLFKQHHPNSNWVAQGDLQNIDFEDDTFDLSILNEVLEHVPDDLAALKEVYRVIKPRGKVIIFSPNRFFPFESHGVYLKGSDKKIPPYFPFIPYIPLSIGNQLFRYWARNYWPKELRDMTIKAGFQIVHTTYIWQTFENISGTQPALMRKSKDFLRWVSNTLEKTPVLRSFGISQIIIAQK